MNPVYFSVTSPGAVPFPYREALPMIQYLDEDFELLGEPVYGRKPRDIPRGAKYWRAFTLYTPPKIDSFGAQQTGA